MPVVHRNNSLIEKLGNYADYLTWLFVNTLFGIQSTASRVVLACASSNAKSSSHQLHLFNDCGNLQKVLRKLLFGVHAPEATSHAPRLFL